ncbi:MAG: hypothetical protein ACH34U_07160, partial [Cyanobium sp.]
SRGERQQAGHPIGYRHGTCQNCNTLVRGFCFIQAMRWWARPARADASGVTSADYRRWCGESPQDTRLNHNKWPPSPSRFRDARNP